MKILKKEHTKLAFLILFILILTCFIFYGISTNKSSENSTASYSETREALGTIVTITLYGTEDNPISEDRLKSVTKDLFKEADRLEHIFSAKLNDSELSHVNASAAAKNVSISKELFEVFDISLNYCNLSKGAFDISIGKLIKLWNIGSDNPYLPSKDELADMINKGYWKQIHLDREHQTVSYGSNNISVDLGAAAKGYIGDRLKSLAESKGITCGLLSLGGNIVTIGSRYTGGSWTIGITNPLSPDSVIGSLNVENMSVVTSGDYERYFIKDGVKYHHILDGRTGYPSNSGIISSTITGPSSAICDVLSTACFVLGIDDGMSLIEKTDRYEAVFIDTDGKIHTSSGIDKYNFTVN